MVKMLDIPCKKCAWRMPGFHLCIIDLTTPEGIRRATFVESTVLGAPSLVDAAPSPTKAKKRAGRTHQPSFGSEEDRANRAEAVRQARARDVGRAERDEQIVKYYDDEEISMNGISKIMGIDYRTVSSALHKAASAGLITLRQNTGGRSRRATA